jgi:serine/threonine protein kinase
MNYQANTHCPNCFRTSSSAICPHCGFNREDYLKKEAASHHLPLFTQLGKEYVLGRVLGEGGFAIVYAALRPEDQLACAVKEYYPQVLAKRGLDGKTVNPKSEQAVLDSWQNRFIQEGELLRRCYDYPSVESGVVRYADLLRQHNTAYLVMERLNGQPLGDYLKQGKTLPAEDICLWLKPLLETLQKLHGKNIYHRDISPNNIFLCHADKPVLMDFGLARAGVRDSLHLTSTLGAGTFIAPEQLNGGRCDQRTDLYSLGAVIYLCLHGQAPPPVDARRQGTLLTRMQQTDNISLALQRAAVVCLELSIDKRPANAAQVLKDLEVCWQNQDKVITPPENKNQETIISDFQPSNKNLDSVNQKTIIQGEPDSVSKRKETSELNKNLSPKKEELSEQSETQRKSSSTLKLLFLMLLLFYIAWDFEGLKSRLTLQSSEEEQKNEVEAKVAVESKAKADKTQPQAEKEAEKSEAAKPTSEVVAKPVEAVKPVEKVEQSRLEMVEGQPTFYVVPDKLNLRSDTSTNSSANIITRLNQNDAVTLLATTTSSKGDVWAKIRAGSYEGWVNKGKLSKNKSIPLLVPSVVLTQSSASVKTGTFSKAECISHLTSKDIIPQYRLSLVKATALCNAIEERINLLSKQILGKWQSISEGKTVTLQFFADGTAKRDFGTESSVEKWAIVNPYSTLGAESIQFDDSYLSQIKFSGSMMIITSQPATEEIIERWERVE